MRLRRELLRAPAALTRRVRGFPQYLSRRLHPLRRDLRRRYKMNLSQWLLYHQRNIVFQKCYWMGLRALKNPLDAWIYQEIIYDVKPDLIIEIGSLEGGSTLYFANLLDLLGHGTVVSIDVDRSQYRANHPRIVTITSDSLAPETIARVSELCRGRAVLAVHDGNHTKEHVLKDLQAYSKLVSVGSYFIVEDGIIDLFQPGDGIGQVEDGPLVAVDEFLRSNSNFVADAERERYILTYNPKGFLKRMS